MTYVTQRDADRAEGFAAGLDAAAMWAANNIEGNSFYVAASIRALRPPAAPASQTMTNDLDAKLALADGKADCTCNVAAHSSDPREHDPYCAFRVLHEAAAKIEHLRALRPPAAPAKPWDGSHRYKMDNPSLSASAPAGAQEVTRRIAAELAPELDRLITAHIDGGMMLGSSQHTELEGFLWNDKVGILRILQAHAAAPAGARPSEEDKQLAEVDALVAVFAFQIDPSPPDTWPKDSILSKAIQRHSARLMALYQRGKE